MHKQKQYRIQNKERARKRNKTKTRSEIRKLCVRTKWKSQCVRPHRQCDNRQRLTTQKIRKFSNAMEKKKKIALPMATPFGAVVSISFCRFSFSSSYLFVMHRRLPYVDCGVSELCFHNTIHTHIGYRVYHTVRLCPWGSFVRWIAYIIRWHSLRKYYKRLH